MASWLPRRVGHDTPAHLSRNQFKVPCSTASELANSRIYGMYIRSMHIRAFNASARWRRENWARQFSRSESYWSPNKSNKGWKPRNLPLYIDTTTTRGRITERKLYSRPSIRTCGSFFQSRQSRLLTLRSQWWILLNKCDFSIFLTFNLDFFLNLFCYLCVFVLCI